MKAWIGKSIVAIGVIHSIFGFVAFRSTIGTLLGEGLFNTVNQQSDREAVFWFLVTGFALLIVGALVNWIERTQAALSSSQARRQLAARTAKQNGNWLFWAPFHISEQTKLWQKNEVGIDLVFLPAMFLPLKINWKRKWGLKAAEARRDIELDGGPTRRGRQLRLKPPVSIDSP